MKFSYDRKWYALFGVAICVVVGVAYIMTDIGSEDTYVEIMGGSGDSTFEFSGYTLSGSSAFSDVDEVSVVLSKDIFAFDDVTLSDHGYIEGVVGDESEVDGSVDAGDDGTEEIIDGNSGPSDDGDGESSDVVVGGVPSNVEGDSDKISLFEKSGVGKSDTEIVDAMIEEFSGYDMSKTSERSQGDSGYGYMQVTESTAKEMAERLGVGYSLDKLKNDKVYNVKIGYEYLKYVREFSEDLQFSITAYVYGVAGAKAVFQKSGTYETEISNRVLSRMD